MSTEEDREHERINPLTGEVRANPPSTRNLTIIWEEERKELFGRIEALEADVKFLKADIKTILEAQSRFLAYSADADKPSEERYAKLQHLKHGIPEVDYEGPTEGKR